MGLLDRINAAFREIPGAESVRVQYLEGRDRSPQLNAGEQSFEFRLRGPVSGKLALIAGPAPAAWIATLRMMSGALIDQFQAEARERLLLEELSVDWEALEALYEITSNVRLLTDSRQILEKLLSRAVLVGKAFLGDTPAAALWRLGEGWMAPASAEYAPALQSAPPFSSWAHSNAPLKNTMVWNGPAAHGELPPPLHSATCLIAAPLFDAQRSLEGALVLWSDRPGMQLDSRAVRLIEALALQAAMVISSDQLRRTLLENERMKSEIEIGARIQQTLLFEDAPADLDGLSAAAVTMASQTIGGDFYHFLQSEDGFFDVAVGDVMGKGVAAALMGAAAKLSLLRAAGRFRYASESAGTEALEPMLDYVSRLLTPEMIRSGRFLSLCYARIDPSRRRLTYCDHGHTGILHARSRSGDVVTLRGSNMPMGFAENDPAEQFQATLEARDILLFFSDGVTEARGPDGSLFGPERLAAALAECRSESAKECLQGIQNAVEAFTTVATFADDFTLIAVVVLPERASAAQGRSTLSIRADFERLHDARQWLGLFCEDLTALELGPDDVEALQLALTEAVTNVIRHALLGRDGEIVRLDATRHSDRLQLAIVHSGLPFDPVVVPEPAFDGSREGGFGIFIMRHCVDELKYATLPDGRQSLELIKFFRRKEK